MPNRALPGNKKRSRTLLLTDRDIKKLITMRQAIDIIRKVFTAHGRSAVQMPPKIYIHLKKYNGDFRAMPAYVEGLEACGVKWVNVHPRNRAHGLPVVMALIVLSDPRTGYPLAIMDGTYITSLRTGAAGGIAAKYLANKGSSHIGFVGCGVQALFQLMALQYLFKIKTITAYDQESSHAKQFIRHARSLGVTAKIAVSIEACVRDKDIVVTTTPSRKPAIKAAWISPGTHINAIGADARGKEELDPELLKKAKIIVDDIAQATHSGEINVPLAKKLLRVNDIRATLGQVMVGAKRGRVSPSEITIFDSTGLAIQDMAVASYVYKSSIARSRKPKTISFL